MRLIPELMYLMWVVGTGRSLLNWLHTVEVFWLMTGLKAIFSLHKKRLEKWVLKTSPIYVPTHPPNPIMVLPAFLLSLDPLT